MTTKMKQSRRVVTRDGNTGQPAPFRPSLLLARQKRGGAGWANLRGWAQTCTSPRLKANWQAGPSIFLKKKFDCY